MIYDLFELPPHLRKDPPAKPHYYPKWYLDWLIWRVYVNSDSPTMIEAREQYIAERVKQLEALKPRR